MRRKEEIRQGLSAYLREKGVSQTKFANDHEFNRGYLSALINETESKYHTPEFLEKVAKAVGMESNDAAWKHFDTDAFKGIVMECDYARSSRVVSCIDMGTGSGKSHSLQRYQKQTPNTFLLQCKGGHTQGKLLADILKKIGKKEDEIPRGLLERTNMVIETLSRKENGLLILDETEYLQWQSGLHSAWHAIKDLVENLKGKCGIVISGAGIQKRLTTLNHSKYSEANGWEQLYSRLRGNWIVKEKLDRSDSKILGAWRAEIKHICLMLMICTDVDFVNHISMKADNIRDVENMLRKTISYSRQKGKEINYHFISTLYGE